MTTVENRGVTFHEPNYLASYQADGIVEYDPYCPIHGTYKPAANATHICTLTDEEKEKYRQYFRGDFTAANFKAFDSCNDKYVDSMKAGYTGYVPRYPFKFGNAYPKECDICIREMFDGRLRQTQLKDDLARSAKEQPLHSINDDPLVRDRLNEFAKHCCNITTTDNQGDTTTPNKHAHRQIPGYTGFVPRSSHANRKDLIKPLSEPAIPGYTGYIPRVYTTDTGLGSRYHVMSRDGLELFCDETAARAERRKRDHNQTTIATDGTVKTTTELVCTCKK